MLCVQIPEAFTSPQREPEVHLVGCALQSSAVCQYNLDVVVAARVGVYHHSIEHSRVFVLMLYIEVIAWNLTIKDTFWNVQLRALLLHAPRQTRKLTGSVWTDPVLEHETCSADEGCNKDEGCKNADERDAGRLHAE